MTELSENIEQFLTQQIELYGDDFVVDSSKLEFVSENSNQRSDNWKESVSLASFYESIKDCKKCPLNKTRNKFVFGEGSPGSDIMLIGEAPGGDEDRIGKPFVGAAGQLLIKILAAIKLTREEVYICNILKCRPPKNENPLPDEIEKCEPYLHKQIELIKPQFILCLGRFAAQTLLRTRESLGSLRGRIHNFQNSKLIVTYHPAALLRYPEYKKPTWEDVQLLQDLYNKWKRTRIN